jgi:hypothetical protein
MKIYKFKKPNIEAKNVSDLLNYAEVSNGQLIFFDELHQLWKLEKLEEVEVEESE